ncbi:TPA: Replication protein E1, partial [Stenotrophomonas maltophilia]
MRIDNIPSVGSSVNTSGHFEPTRRYSRARGAPASAAVVIENENTASLEEARTKQRAKIEKEWVAAHEVDSRGKVKPPSLEYIFGGQITSGKIGKWACQASEASGAVIHKWDGTFWKAVSTDVGVGVASEWLKNNAKHAVSQKRAASCWEHAIVDLRSLNPLPVQSDKRAIVPCADYYIEVLPTGFQALKPDP